MNSRFLGIGIRRGIRVGVGGGGAPGPTPPPPVFALTGFSSSNRYQSEVGAGDPGLADSWGIIHAYVLTNATADGGVKVMSQCGGLASVNSGWTFANSTTAPCYFYGGSGISGTSTRTLHTLQMGRITVECIQIVGGKLRRFHGYVKLRPEPNVSFVPATGVRHYIGPQSNSGADSQFIGQATFSGTFSFDKWLEFLDDFRARGGMPVSLDAYGVTMRHRWDVRDDSAEGTVVPASLTDSGSVGDSNLSRIGTLTLVTHTTPVYDYGGAAVDCWIAIGDSLMVGTGASADLPAGFNDRVGLRWRASVSAPSAGWDQLVETGSAVSLADMFVYRRTLLTNKPCGLVEAGYGGTTAAHWVDNTDVGTGPVRTRAINTIKAAAAENPRGTYNKFLISLGTNGTSGSAAAGWSTQMESLMGSIINELAPEIVLPSDVYVVYMILRETSPAGREADWATVRSQQFAKHNTTSTIAGRTVHWIGIEEDDDNMADELHPTTAGYDIWGTAAAAAASDVE